MLVSMQVTEVGNH